MAPAGYAAPGTGVAQRRFVRRSRLTREAPGMAGAGDDSAAAECRGA